MKLPLRKDFHDCFPESPPPSFPCIQFPDACGRRFPPHILSASRCPPHSRINRRPHGPQTYPALARLVSSSIFLLQLVTASHLASTKPCLSPIIITLLSACSHVYISSSSILPTHEEIEYRRACTENLFEVELGLDPAPPDLRSIGRNVGRTRCRNG